MRKILSTVAVAVCAASAIVVSNTPALADGGFRYLALRALANTHSVYVTGRGWTNWASGSGSTGQIGSTNSPRGIDACYQHSNPRWQDATNLTVVALIS